MRPLERLRHHVTGAIERGEATPIVEQKAPKSELEQWIADKAQEYAKLEAHAEALAEALRLAVDRLKWLAEALPETDSGGIVKVASEALANWEGAK